MLMAMTMGMVVMGSFAPPQVFAASKSNAQNQKIAAEKSQQKAKKAKEDDTIPNQPTRPKESLGEFKALDNATGRKKFWNSIDPSQLSKYYINDDLSVDFKNASNKTASDIAEKEKFEAKLKQYVSKVEKYCEKKDMKFNDNISDDKGGIIVGGITGDGNGTNKLSVSNLVKGDIVLLNDGGTQIYGAIMHAGIYDGSSVDLCIYSASPNGSPTGVRWERVSDWRKNDQAWTMKVKGTTKQQRATAYNYVRKYATYGEKYDWSASKSSTNKWYCSKIPWYAYKKSSVNIDIDADGGYWCYPVDIYNSSKTQLIKYYK